MKATITAFILAAALSHTAWSASTDVMILPTVTANATPAMDGTLTHPAWQRAATRVLSQTVLPLRPVIAGTQTTLHLLAGPATLYLGIDCRFPPTRSPVGRVREHDAPVFEDESIEVFIAPDGRPGDNVFYHFALNSRGAATERKQLDPAWDAAWERAVRSADDRWIATLAIPLNLLVEGQPDGHYWRLNVCRNLYDQRGSFLQGLTLQRPGYYDPALPLVCGDVRAATLEAAIDATLSEVTGNLEPYLAGPLKQRIRQLKVHRAAFAVEPNAAVPPEKAATILELALERPGALPDQVIWNFMFASDTPEGESP